MKIIKIIFVSIIVLVVIVVTGVVVFIKTFDINRFRPQIIESAKSAFNRDVDFRSVSLGISLTQGIDLRISDLVIKEDPAFQKGDFFTVKNISLGVDLLRFLSRREVSLSNILIDSPKVTVIRQKDGRLNVETLKPKPQVPKTGARASTAAIPAFLSTQAAALPAVSASSLKVTGGTVSYIDHSFEPPVSLDVRDLTVSVNNISLTEPFSFVVEGRVLSDQKNIRVEGMARIDLSTNTVTVFELKGTSDLSLILLKSIPESLPMAKGAVLPMSLKGKAEVAVAKMSAGPKGLTALTANASLRDGVVHLKEVPSSISDIAMTAKLAETEVVVDNASASIGEGTIKGSGTVEDYLTKQSFSIDASAENIKIQDVAPAQESPVKVEGVASGTIKLKGRGFTQEALNSSLSGEGRIVVKDAILKNINVLRTVLDKIAIIPNLSDKIETSLPDRYKKKLDQKDTVLGKIDLPLTITNGRIVVQNTVITADEFVFKGRTEADLRGAYSIEGSFLIPQELSAAMVTAAPQLQYLLDENKEIFIPVKVAGSVGQMKVSVDAEYVAKKLLENQAKTQLLKVINKAVGVKDEGASTATGAEDQVASGGGGGNQSPAEEVVGGILGSIFKK